MSKWFARHGYTISMITWDEGQPEAPSSMGSIAQGMCPQRRNCRVAVLPPQMDQFVAGHAKGGCGYLLLQLRRSRSRQVVMWCRRHARKCVQSVACEADCDPSLPLLKPLRERLLYRYGLHHVDRIVTQTRRQQQMLRDGSGLESTVISMPCEGFDEHGCAQPAASRQGSPHVLWVGRITRRSDWNGCSILPGGAGDHVRRCGCGEYQL